MSLYSIAETLKKTERCVFTLKDIAMVGGLKDSVARVYISRMLKKGLLKRIERGKYTSGEDAFATASQLVFPSYISFLPALYMHGLTEQMVSRITVASPRRKMNLSVFGTPVVFVRMKPSMMFGFRRIKKGSTFVVLADPEKAAIDILYKPAFGPISYLAGVLEKLDSKKLEDYAIRSGSEAVVRRAGFLMDKTGMQHSLQPSSGNAYSLNPSIKRKGEFDKKWRLYVNEVIE